MKIKVSKNKIDKLIQESELNEKITNPFRKKIYLDDDETIFRYKDDPVGTFRKRRDPKYLYADVYGWGECVVVGKEENYIIVTVHKEAGKMISDVECNYNESEKIYVTIDNEWNREHAVYMPLYIKDDSNDNSNRNEESSQEEKQEETAETSDNKDWKKFKDDDVFNLIKFKIEKEGTKNYLLVNCGVTYQDDIDIKMAKGIYKMAIPGLKEDDDEISLAKKYITALYLYLPIQISGGEKSIAFNKEIVEKNFYHIDVSTPPSLEDIGSNASSLNDDTILFYNDVWSMFKGEIEEKNYIRTHLITSLRRTHSFLNNNGIITENIIRIGDSIRSVYSYGTFITEKYIPKRENEIIEFDPNEYLESCRDSNIYNNIQWVLNAIQKEEKYQITYKSLRREIEKVSGPNTLLADILTYNTILAGCFNYNTDPEEESPEKPQSQEDDQESEGHEENVQDFQFKVEKTDSVTALISTLKGTTKLSERSEGLLVPIAAPRGFLGLKRFVRDPMAQIRNMKSIADEYFSKYTKKVSKPSNLSSNNDDQIAESFSRMKTFEKELYEYFSQDNIKLLLEGPSVKPIGNDEADSLAADIENYLTEAYNQIRTLMTITLSDEASSTFLNNAQGLLHMSLEKKAKDPKDNNKKEKDLTKAFFDVIGSYDSNIYDAWKPTTNQSDLDDIIYQICHYALGYNSVAKSFNINNNENGIRTFANKVHQWVNSQYSVLIKEEEIIKLIDDNRNKHPKSFTTWYNQTYKNLLLETLKSDGLSEIIEKGNKHITETKGNQPYTKLIPFLLGILYVGLSNNSQQGSSGQQNFNGSEDFSANANESIEMSHRNLLLERGWTNDIDIDMKTEDLEDFNKVRSKLVKEMSDAINSVGGIRKFQIVRTFLESCEALTKEVDTRVRERIQKTLEDGKKRAEWPIRANTFYTLWAGYVNELKFRSEEKLQMFISSEAFKEMISLLQNKIPTILALLIFIRKNLRMNYGK